MSAPHDEAHKDPAGEQHLDVVVVRGARPGWLGFVNDDAAYLTDRIATRHRAAASATAGITQQPST